MEDPSPVPPGVSDAGYPVWIWPNLVGLDAAAVAVVWQRFLAAAYGVPVPAAASVALALVVWGAYLADRWLDAGPGRPAEAADRHRFTRRYRPVVGGMAVFVVGAAAVPVVTLPTAYLGTGAATAAAVTAYFAAVHGARATATRELGKAFAVGLLFAAGVVVPLAADRPAGIGDWLPGVGAFAALCWLNCRFIAVWELPRERWVVGPLFGGGIALGLGVLAPAPVMLAVAASLVLLGALHLRRGRVSLRARRVLADAALLTPLAAAPLL